jgi:hypothetical protein
MQAIVATRQRSFWALIFVLAVGAALIVAALGFYLSTSTSASPSSGSGTTISQPGQAGPHGRYGGFQ